MNFFGPKREDYFDGAASDQTGMGDGGYGGDDHGGFQGDDSFLRIVKVVELRHAATLHVCDV